MISALELLQGLLVCMTAALIYGGPWWFSISRQFNFENRIWPSVIVCLIMGLIFPSVIGYALLMLHCFSWLYVAIINAIVAFSLAYYFSNGDSEWHFSWNSENKNINMAIFSIATLSVVWRVNWLIQEYSARSYDSVWHLAYTIRGLEGISPTGYFSIYPLGMHGLLASWCTFFDLNAMWLWLPILHVIISVGTLLIFSRIISPNQQVSLLVFTLITWASINPLALYTIKVAQPLPQGFAFTVMIFVLILLSRNNIDRGWMGFCWISICSIVSLHNLTALYAAVVFVIYSLINHSLNEKGNWLKPSRTCFPDLVIGLCVPLLVAFQLVLASKVIWLSGIESHDNSVENEIEVIWDDNYVITVTTENVLQLLDGGLNSTLSNNENNWTIIPNLPTGIENTYSNLSMIDATNVNIENLEWLTIIYNPLTDLDLEFTTTYANLTFNVSTSSKDEINRGCIHAFSANLDDIVNCDLKNGSWEFDVPDVGFEWVTWRLEYHLENASQYLGKFHIWATESSVNLSEVQSSLPELPDDIDTLLQLENDFGLFATLSWEPNSSDCPSPAKSKTIRWSDGAKFPMLISYSKGYGLCNGNLNFSVEGLDENYSVSKEYQFEIDPYSGANLECYSEENTNLVSEMETSWDSSGYFTGKLSANCIIQNTGNIILNSTLYIPQNDVDRMDLSGMQPHSELKLENISIEINPTSKVEFELIFDLRGIEFGTLWDVPLMFGNYSTVFSLPVPNEEIEIGTKEIVFGEYALNFLKWKPHYEWLEANAWWFLPLAIVHLCVIFDRRFSNIFRSLAAASFSLQIIQTTGFLAYPADWAQQRLAHFLLISMPLAIVEFTRVWGMWLFDKLEIKKLTLFMKGVSKDVSTFSAHYITPVVMIILVLTGGPQINPTVMNEVSWDISESVDEGDYAIDLKTAFMSDISGPNTNFISASGVISKWGVGESNLTSWKCNTDEFSIIVTDNNNSDVEIKNWLYLAIGEDSRRWSLQQTGDGWEHWKSIPAIEIGSIEIEIGGGELDLYWDTNFSHSWYDIKLDILTENVSMDDENYVIQETSTWMACNPDLGVVSPKISYLLEGDN